MSLSEKTRDTSQTTRQIVTSLGESRTYSTSASTIEAPASCIKAAVVLSLHTKIGEQVSADRKTPLLIGLVQGCQDVVALAKRPSSSMICAQPDIGIRRPGLLGPFWCSHLTHLSLAPAWHDVAGSRESQSQARWRYALLREIMHSAEYMYRVDTFLQRLQQG